MLHASMDLALYIPIPAVKGFISTPLRDMGCHSNESGTGMLDSEVAVLPGAQHGED